MKQFFAVLLCCALLAGCGAGASQSIAASSSAPAEDSSTAQAPTATPTAAPLSDEERPVAVAVSNRPGAIAHWGLAQAEILLEARTDNNDEYTDYCLLFPTVDDVPKVGPIAPAKDLFLQLAVPQNALLAQRGMNRYGENLLNQYGLQPLDALYLGVNTYDYDRTLPAETADEYRWYTSGGALRNGLALYGLTSKGGLPGLLASGTPTGGTDGARQVEVKYSNWYSCHFALDASTGLWSLLQADGTVKLDANDQQPVAFRNLLLLACEVQLKDDGHTLDYDLSEGTGYYLYGGHWQAIRWQKADDLAALQLVGANGKALAVDEGHTYIGLYNAAAPTTVTLTDGAGAVLNR